MTTLDQQPLTRHATVVSSPQAGCSATNHAIHVAAAPANTTQTRLILALLSLTIFVTITYEILPIGLLTPDR